MQPPLQPIPWPDRPWQHLQIDIAGEFVAALQSHKYMIVVHDLHSKWSEVSCTSSVTSGTVIKPLQELFTRWGLPDRDVDNSRKPGKLPGCERDFSGCKHYFFLQNVFKCCQKIVIYLFRLFTPSLLSYLN